MPRFACTLAVLLLLSPSAPAEELSYFLPTSAVRYEKSIPTPAEFLGFEIGERHITHAQLVAYASRLAEASPRITLQQYARSHGQRPLILLTITSEANHARLGQIRKQHHALSLPEQSADIDIDSLPAVINMGYSVHGDESSGANAAPVVLYHLAAATGDDIETLLSQVVVLMDPCLNPDGFDRFANWANSYRGRTINPDPAHAEHNQPWPGGRVNYYWFDLNRDWLPAVHPESQGRLRKYHQWKPDVVLDFHEMGTSSTYFFQPGIPQRANPLIPERNIELTNRFAQYHAKALDKLGSLYFTEEVFDDFYPGKGSSYPDLHGAVGILFEQASSRGHVQDSPQGPLRFAFTIRNHVATSFSSLAATQEARVDLLRYRRSFHREALAEARDQPVKNLVFSCEDSTRLRAFARVLQQHDIRLQWTTRNVKAGDHSLPAGSVVVPLRQPEYRFVRALTERRTSFRENIFYDVSTWTLPLAFDLNSHELQGDLPADATSNDAPAPAEFAPDDDAVAWTIDTASSASYRLLASLLRAGARLRVATQPFAAADRQDARHPAGTVIVPLGIQHTSRERLGRIMRQGAATGVRLNQVPSGLTPEGIDLGSNSMRPLKLPRVLLVTDGGVSRYSAGAAWHLLDTRVGLPVTLVPQSRLASVDLAAYTTIVLPTGSYRSLPDTATTKLEQWLSAGGTLIACGTATQWVSQQKLAGVDFRSTVDAESGASDTNEHHHEHKPYDSARTDQALRLISGAIFEARVDLTHPLAYGMRDDRLPLFRNNRVIMDPSGNAYSNPVVCTDQPLLSGYCSEENVKLIAGSASVIVRGRGRGRVVLIAEDPNFRGFWYGSNRLFLNAVFFGSIIREP